MLDEPVASGMTGLLEKKPGVLSPRLLVGRLLALAALVAWVTWLVR